VTCDLCLVTCDLPLPLQLLIDVTGLLFLGRLLEPVWGTKEFIRFVVVTSSSTAVCTFVLIFLVYCFTRCKAASCPRRTLPCPTPVAQNSTEQLRTGTE